MTFKIQSLLEEAKAKTTGTNVLMGSQKEFLQTMEESEGAGFALVLNKRRETKGTKRKKLPEEIQGILQG